MVSSNPISKRDRFQRAVSPFIGRREDVITKETTMAAGEIDSTPTVPKQGDAESLHEPPDEHAEVSPTTILVQQSNNDEVWWRALEALPNDDQVVASQCLTDSRLDVLQKLQATLEARQEEYQKRGLHFKFHGRQYVLRDVTERIVFWINKFKEIGDLVVTFDPFHAALPWAGLRFLLGVSYNHILPSYRWNYEYSDCQNGNIDDVEDNTEITDDGEVKSSISWSIDVTSDKIQYSAKSDKSSEAREEVETNADSHNERTYVEILHDKDSDIKNKHEGETGGAAHGGGNRIPEHVASCTQSGKLNHERASDEFKHQSTSDCENSQSTRIQTRPMAKPDIILALNYAICNWPFHVQRHGEEKIDDRLAGLLKKFLGCMNESGTAYRHWLANSNYIHVLYPSSQPSIAICTFGFHKVISDWWEVGFANVNQRNQNGKSLLQLSAENNNFSIAEELINLGAEVESQADYRMNIYSGALQATAGNGHIKIVNQLLHHGASVNTVCSPPKGTRLCNYATALQAAVAPEDIAIVNLLLQKGADVNVTGRKSITALHIAVSYGNRALAELLLQHGADANIIDIDSATALHVAAEYQDMAMIKLLIKQGVDVNVTEIIGTALHALMNNKVAEDEDMENKNILTAKLLLEKGADVNITGESFGAALGAALSHNDMAIAKLLLKNGADVNRGSNLGVLLQYAAVDGSVKIVELLLEKGADVNILHGQWGTPLQIAASYDNMAIALLLLKNGANVNIVSGHYGTALQAAAYRGRMAMVKLLLDKKTNVNITGGHFGTALQAAAYRGKTAMVKLLLKHGANVSLEGREYGSALQAAEFKRYWDIVQLLQQEEVNLEESDGEQDDSSSSSTD